MSDVVDLILNDHRELERLFAELRSDPSKRKKLAPLMSTLLFAHSRAEEAEVYPEARLAGGGEDVEHSQKEHLEADQIAEQLSQTAPDSPEFDDVLERLIDAVTHHVEEEESTVLPHLREHMSAEQLTSLGERFIAARGKHIGDQPADITKDQLTQQASNIDLDAAFGMSKEQLKDTLADEAES
jgi:hemerythrin superfamily protein